MSKRVRLLPVLMMAAITLFGLKTISIWTGVNAFMTGIGTAVAEEPVRTHTETVEAHVDDGHDDHKEASKADEEGGHQGEKKPSVKKAAARQVDSRDSSFYSRSEIEVLQQLGDRRQQLEAREREIAMREQLLVAAEQRLEQKVAELKEIEAKIQTLLVQKEGEEEKKIASLVKVYESMKAKDAARIFDKLEMEVLLPVAQRMKEQKFAAVLAKMESGAAQRLTVELAAEQEYEGAEDVSAELIDP